MKKRFSIGIGLLLLCILLCGCDGKEPDAYELGIQALAVRDDQTAIEKFQYSIDAGDRKAESYRGLGIVDYLRGDYEDAISMFTLSLEDTKKGDAAFREDVLFYLADSYVKNGQTKEAEEIYEELLTGSNKGCAFLQKGIVHLLNGETEVAKTYFDEAVKYVPKYDTYIDIYGAYASVNMEGDGAKYLEEALTLEAKNDDELFQQGKVYYLLHEYDKAQVVLSKAAEDGKMEAVLLLGKLCLETNNVAGAREQYLLYLREGTRSAVAYNGLALCDMAEGNYENALINIANGLDYNDQEERESLLYNEIIVYERILDFETAKQKMAAFLTEYPDNEEAARENVFLQSR